MKTDPTPEHAWLQQLIGEWTYEMEAPGEPGAPPQKFTGTESIRGIGELWIQGEGRGTTPDDKPAIAFLTIGYNAAKKRYVGTWFGSMMDFLWVYDGSRDGNVLTLETTGPSFDVDGAMANYREVIELKAPSERTFTSFVQGDDGGWKQLMAMTYRRVK